LRRIILELYSKLIKRIGKGKNKMGDYSDVDALKEVNEALGKIDSEGQARVLNWMVTKYLGGPIQQPTRDPAIDGERSSPPNRESTQAPPTNPKPKSAKNKTGKKAKPVYKQLKDLNLKPAGKTSAVDFVEEKKPSNLLQKCVVALYYLVNTLELEAVTTDHIYTFYKFMQWPVPSDLVNTLQQTGTKGWLDTANSSDIKITHMGDNLVEHELPIAAKG
jgi:hypothetical protein